MRSRLEEIFTILAPSAKYGKNKWVSKKAADKTTNYYAADTQAKNTLAIIDETLYQIYQSCDSEETYYQKLSTIAEINNLPQNVSPITIVLTENQTLLAYRVTISEVQTLHVTLSVNYPQSENEWFTSVEQWQTITTNEPDESDEYLNLFTGEE